jgi:hypothetical protein
MIPVTAIMTTPLLKETLTFQTALMRPQRTTTLTPIPEQLAAHPEER